MDEEPTLETQIVEDTEQLIADIEVLISRIRLLRIQIGLHLLLPPEVPPKGGTSGK